jgi:CubicO group peptidase (beta-lactamase class C family)
VVVLLALVTVLALSADLGPVDAFVQTERDRQKVPGVAVAIVRGGEVVKAQGYGLANVEHQVAVRPETIFQSGSVGKQFTSTAVMLLVEEGKLALSDPLTRFFPEAPAPWRGITVRHLLTHTSGLPDYGPETVDYRKDYTEEELARLAFGLKLEFAPGSRWNYSNTGYVLLGIIVGKVSGRFYGDLLAERVFAPLGMKTARVISEADIVPNRAAGYRLVDGQLKNQEWVAPKLNTTAAGSLYLSVLDLVAWDRGLRAGAVLKPASWGAVLTPVRLNSGRPYPYGFAWGVEETAGQAVHRHGGAWQGFTSAIARFLGSDLTVVVLANLAEADPTRFVDGIASLLDSRLAKPELAPIADTEPTSGPGSFPRAPTSSGRLSGASGRRRRCAPSSAGTSATTASTPTTWTTARSPSAPSSLSPRTARSPSCRCGRGRAAIAGEATRRPRAAPGPFLDR